MMASFLAFFCALRNSEVCKLKWQDIDLENKRLRPDSSLQREPEEAEVIIRKIIPDEAGVESVLFDPQRSMVIIEVEKPGLAIGKSGTNIAMLTETIGKRFGIDNPQLEIKEIERPELDAQAVANRFKAVIERGFSWRSVIFKGLNDILRAGAQGAEIVVSGKLAGKGGRKKQVRVGSGYMKKVGEQARLVDYGQAAAYPKVGAIGIKVKIVKPDTIFPDKERIQPYIKKKKVHI